VKAIIMAAGIGSRIHGVIGEKPKCLIEVNGQTLIERTVKLLQERGVSDVAVITGYKSDLIHEKLGSTVRYFHNEDYRTTNSIASLWLAREMLDDDVLLMNADLYFEEAILDLAFAQDRSAVMLSDSTRIDDADFRFGVEGSRILLTGNRLSNAETDCEYVGIVRIDASFVGDFRRRLKRMINCDDLNNWWEGVLYSFIEDGVSIFHEDVNHVFWTEVDNVDDYRRLEGWISKDPMALLKRAVAGANGVT